MLLILSIRKKKSYAWIFFFWYYVLFPPSYKFSSQEWTSVMSPSLLFVLSFDLHSVCVRHRNLAPGFMRIEIGVEVKRSSALFPAQAFWAENGQTAGGQSSVWYPAVPELAGLLLVSIFGHLKKKEISGHHSCLCCDWAFPDAAFFSMDNLDIRNESAFGLSSGQEI